MIRGDERLASSDQREFIQVQPPVEVEVVEVEEWNQTGICPATAHVLAQIHAAVALGHKARGEPARPFVEITDHDYRPRKLFGSQHAASHQEPCLMAPLHETSAQNAR